MRDQLRPCLLVAGNATLTRARSGSNPTRAANVPMAEWLGAGLQNLLRRFNSGSVLHSGVV